MQITFKSQQKLGNKVYKAGQQVIPDYLAGNKAFQALVKQGIVIIHAKDASQQAVQASKDAHNSRKAEIARKLTAKMAAEKK